MLGMVGTQGLEIVNLNMGLTTVYTRDLIQDHSPLCKRRVGGLLPEKLEAKIRGWTPERAAHLEIHELP